jgi:hypothetical protein
VGKLSLATLDAPEIGTGIMASCHLCGTQIPKGQGVRKTLYTGMGISGFSLFSSVLLDWILNTALRRRPAFVRSYYSVKMICGPCAASAAAADKRKLLVLLGVALLVITVLALVIVPQTLCGVE